MKFAPLSKKLLATSMAALGASATALFVVPGHTQTAEVKIYTPANEIEKKAQGVLEKHCARCHQEGKLEGGRLKPSKEFGNVMQLDQLLADVSRAKFGNPDGSRIFELVVNKKMPFDLYDGDYTKPEPQPDEIEALRVWLKNAKAPVAAACLTGKGTYSEAYAEITKDLGQLPDHRRGGARYITLANLALNCGSPEELEAFRQATAKLLNSLSTNSDPLTLTPIDKEKILLRFNLEDLGWTPAIWESITGIYPYGVRPAESSYDFVAQTTHTRIPLIRADWFAFTASRPPLYETILGLPPTFQELQRNLGLDVTRNIAEYVARRAGFQKSGVSQNNRLIERHPIATGAFWTSYDFGGNRNRQSLFEFPLGPGGEMGFEHDGGETIFNLPNGYQAYYLNDVKGQALAKGPTSIVQDKSRKDLSVTNGISCMGCHISGIRPATDEIRAQVETLKTFPLEVREAVKALYPPTDVMDKQIKADSARFLTALKNSGVGPKLDLNGVEIINALSDRYEREIDLKAAAAEFGVSVDELEKNMTAAGGLGPSLVTRLKLGTVQRDAFEFNFAGLVESIVDGEYIAPADAPAITVAKAGDALDLQADKADYALGDKPVFTVRSNKDCHLTLINVDPRGEAVVIFPNRFQQDNAIKADTAFNFPNADSAFDFKFTSKGTETVIAICDEAGTALAEVTHDYAAQALTELGKGSVATRKIDVVKRKVEAGQDIARTAVKLNVK